MFIQSAVFLNGRNVQPPLVREGRAAHIGGVGIGNAVNHILKTAGNGGKLFQMMPRRSQRQMGIFKSHVGQNGN